MSWTDSKIQVEVPGKAGSGIVEVETSAGTTTEVSGLIVTYAVSTVRFTDKNIITNVFNGQEAEHALLHVGQADNTSNGNLGDFENGAYVFKYHTDFNTNPATKTAFENAFNLMVCEGGANFKISNQTTSAKNADDKTNSIHFGGTPNGVLASVTKRHAYEYIYTPSGYYVMYFFIYEMDYSYNDQVSWSFDSSATTTSEYDFNAISRHETAHAAGLGHVIDNQKIMHWSVGTGDKSQLKSDITYSPSIAKINHDKTITPPSGNSIEKIDFSDCYKQSLGIDTFEQSAFQLYPNPASDFITVVGLNAIEAVAIYNITGALTHKANVADGIGSKEVTIDLSSYTSGIYFIKVSDVTGGQPLKFIIE